MLELTFTMLMLNGNSDTSYLFGKQNERFLWSRKFSQNIKCQFLCYIYMRVSDTSTVILLFFKNGLYMTRHRRLVQKVMRL